MLRLFSLHYGLPSGDSSIYFHCWLALKSQSTIFRTIRSRILDLLPEFEPSLQSTLGMIVSMINTMIKSSLMNLLTSVPKVIDSVRRLTEAEEMPPEVEKLIGTFLRALISINRLTQDLDHSREPPVTVAAPPGESLVCRICDNAVPAELFHEHTQSCLTLYQKGTTMDLINGRLSSLQESIGSDFLNCSWPGGRECAQKSVMPSLHLYALASRAVQIDPHVCDAQNELKGIASVLGRWPAGATSSAAAALLPLVKEKLKVTKALEEVIVRLRDQGMRVRPTPTTIADFGFIKRISRGASASVFLALKKKTGDIYAIKATPRRALKHKNEVERVLVEKDILLQFSHPNIVQFFWSFVGRHNLYLVTEFLPGGDLYSLLENLGSLSEDAARTYAMELLQALRYLRENGIVHRDIKPDNILVSESGSLKLTDFGLSYLGMVDRATESAKFTRRPSSCVGTPDYVAPEIILNRPHSFSVDYWSLGAMIYEFVCGVPPFHADDEDETYRRALLGHVRFPSNIAISHDLMDLIKGLLKVNPEERLGHSSIEEIITHPWFSNHELLTNAPFVPELSSARDTSYFEQRYEFDHAQDASILKDLADLEGVTPPSTLSSFSSVSIAQLLRANRRAAQKLGIRSSRTQEFAPARRHVQDARCPDDSTS
jgi:serine/threonine protein kinase